MIIIIADKIEVILVAYVIEANIRFFCLNIVSVRIAFFEECTYYAIILRKSNSLRVRLYLYIRSGCLLLHTRV